MASDESWFSDDDAPRKKVRHVSGGRCACPMCKRPEPPPPPPLQRGDAVELAIEVEKELGLAEGAAVVWRKALYRRIPGGWVEVHDAELSRRVADYAGRETPKGPLYLTAAKVRGAVAMVKMRWPAVRELPATKEPPHGS